MKELDIQLCGLYGLSESCVMRLSSLRVNQYLLAIGKLNSTFFLEVIFR
jgi:hypothetical protein